MFNFISKAIKLRGTAFYKAKHMFIQQSTSESAEI